jgi:transcriptional regulator with GAF, ATPase, and Fis domain
MPKSTHSSSQDSHSQSIAAAAAGHITRGVELTDLLGALVDTIVLTVGADRGTLYLIDGAQQKLTSTIAHLPELENISMNIGIGIAGWVAQHCAPLNVPSPSSDPRFDPSIDQQTGYCTNSILAVPVKDSQLETIGVLQLLNAKGGEFTPKDEKSALELAKEAGKVLECTSIYTNLKQHAPIKQDDRQHLAFRYNHIVGESEAMQKVYASVEKAARTDATVLLNGESGTGKELIARAIHVNSTRRDKPFVKVDCTTLPEALVENELFGHEKGAFTGADQKKPGKFEVADGGTLFIDELGELPLRIQGKLLRIIQDREFERVGGTETIKTDIRIICATHRDLETMVEKAEFREDLYYRIRVIPFRIPPLRERGDKDLLRLIHHFVDKFSRRHHRPITEITDGAIQRLRSHSFPGNIRELENCIESAVVMCEGAIIYDHDLPLPRLSGHRSSGNPQEICIGDLQATLSQVEDAHIKAIVQACQGNQSEAARCLGIGRNTLARRLSGLQENSTEPTQEDPG